MQRSNPFRRAIALFTSSAFAMVAVGAVVVVAPTITATTVSAAGELGAGGEYHPLAPERIFDSRPVSSINDVAPLGPKSQGPTVPSFDIQLLGAGAVPAPEADVLAVVVSITVVDPTRAGYLAAYPTGAASTSSVLNFAAGQTIPNLAIVRGGTDGKLTIAIHGATVGSAHVLVDVWGWFSTSAYTAGTPGDLADERGARLVVVNPVRLIDTRNGDAADTPLGPNSHRALQFGGVNVAGTTIPDDAVGALVNLTAAWPTASTFMSVVPDPPTAAPTTSNLNVSAGRVQANLVMVPVGADGKIHIYNEHGNTNFIVDVMGYLRNDPTDTRRGRVVPLTSPYRSLDTREAAWGGVELGPAQAEDWSFAAFAGSVSINGVSVGKQMALLGNLTNASTTRQFPSVSVEPGYLTVYPADLATMPVISNLNSYENVAVPNMAVVKYGLNQTVRVFNARGYADYLLDVSAVVLDD